MYCTWITPKPPLTLVHGKTIFPEAGPWSQRGWGPLGDRARQPPTEALWSRLCLLLLLTVGAARLLFLSFARPLPV